MAYKILTQNSIDNTNIDGARAEHFNAGMRNGIVKGAFNEGNFSALSSNVIMLDTCELRISGHRVVIDEAWTHAFSSKPKIPQRYAVVGQVTVGEDTNVTFDLIVQLTDVNLVKNNLFRQTNGAGIYQEEIGRFTLNTDGSVIDVTRTIDIITGSKGEDLDGTINIGVVKTNTLEAGLEAEVDVEQRYDAEQKKVLTDFNFNIPRGQGIDNLDVELSEASMNAVQNQAIAKAINSKADSNNSDQTVVLKTLKTKNIEFVNSADESQNVNIIYDERTNDIEISGVRNINIVGGAYFNNRIETNIKLVLNTLKTNSITFDDNLHGLYYDASTDTFTLSSNLKIINELALKKSSLLDFVYPLGAVYMSVENTSPASFLGGTWEQLPANYALWTASSGAGGTISAGLPNITGYVGGNDNEAYRLRGAKQESGALYFGNWSSTKYAGNSNGASGYITNRINFNASKSNSIYGNSSTVQPPAYKVYAWKRTA